MKLFIYAMVVCFLIGLRASVTAEEVPASSGRETHQEWMAKMGYQRHSGGWRTIQEIEIIERNKKKNLAEKQWIKQLERFRIDLSKNDSAEVRRRITEISDPYAVPALASALVNEPNRRVRLLYIDALSRIESPEARTTLVFAAIDHPDQETRIDAIDRLIESDPQSVAPFLTAALSGQDNARINRAAASLGRLGVTTVVPQLINVLETQHMTTVGNGTPEGSTTATFTPNGNAGLSMGSNRRQINVPMRNRDVLEALVLLTGENFGWDLLAWRAWLARQRAPMTLDLRRGELCGLSR